MEAELGEGNMKPEVLPKLAQYELTLLDWIEVIEFIFDTLFIHIGRNRVINIQQSNRILAHASADELAECTVNIHFTK